MRRMCLAFVISTFTLFGGSALANEPPHGAVPVVRSNEHVEPLKPTVAIKSFDSRTVSAPLRSRDPMAIRVTDVQPGSTLQLMRQKSSHDAVVPGCIGDCSVLKTAATRAAHYTEVTSIEPQVVSPRDVHVSVVTDLKDVLWPGTRFMVTGKTRDGQVLPHENGVVEGLPSTNEQVLNHATGQVEGRVSSGAMLNSARAWLKEGNLFVSEPIKDGPNLQKAQTLLTEVNAKTALLTQKKAAVELERQKVQQRDPSANQAAVNALDVEISKLDAEIKNETSQATNLHASADLSRVKVISVAAYPAQAQILHENPRLAGTSKPMARTSTVSDPVDGFNVAEIGGIHLDTLRTTVQFPAVSGVSVGSRRTITFQVPDHDEKPAFELQGVRYYRVKPTSHEQINEPPQR